MAGAGLKTWSTGDVLTASDVNTYLMEQSIMVFATATARDAAITSPANGMFAYTTTTPATTLSYYSGAAWVAVDLAGDITGVTAGTAMSGGGTSGTVTMNVDVNGAGSVTATASDYVLIEDIGDGTTKKALISDITALVPQGDLTALTAGTNIDITAATGPVPTINLAIDAAVAFGSDGSGVDVTMHSGTAGDYALWDSSEEKLILEGTSGATVLDVTDGNVVIADGTLSLDSAPAAAWTDSNIVLAGQVFSG